MEDEAPAETEQDALLLTYRVVKLPSGELRVSAEFGDGTPDTRPETEELAFAHTVLLDMLRRQLDRALGEGEAVKRLFLMAVDPDPETEAAARQQEADDLPEGAIGDGGPGQP